MTEICLSGVERVKLCQYSGRRPVENYFSGRRPAKLFCLPFNTNLASLNEITKGKKFHDQKIFVISRLLGFVNPFFQ